jgi:hypothetical protein
VDKGEGKMTEKIKFELFRYLSNYFDSTVSKDYLPCIAYDPTINLTGLAIGPTEGAFRELCRFISSDGEIYLARMSDLKRLKNKKSIKIKTR